MDRFDRALHTARNVCIVLGITLGIAANVLAMLTGKF